MQVHSTEGGKSVQLDRFRMSSMNWDAAQNGSDKIQAYDQPKLVRT